MDTDEENISESRPGRKTGPIIVAILIVTAIAIWLVPGDREPEIADIPLPAVQQAKPPTSKPSLQETAPVVNTADEPLAEGAAARTLIAQVAQDNQPLDQLVEKADELQGKGDLTDAYLLYFYAARKGHPGACLILGKQADPTYFSAGSSPLEKADMEQAHKWYSAAVAAGNPEAERLRSDLRQQVEADAAEGDPRAQRLVLQWK